MALPMDLARSLIGALDEPTLLVEGERTLAANAAARALLGQRIEGGDVRLAIRQPQALSAILAGQACDIELVGIAGAERPWLLTIRKVKDDLRLVRLIDRSAMRAAERMRVDFVANASHELRTPLATIGGYAETLADEGEVDDATRRSFGRMVHGESRRMLRIVEDLMSLSRIEAERFLPPGDSVDLGEVAKMAASNARPVAEKQPCTIDIVVENGMRPVLGDFPQLVQTADNLLANAVRYGCTQAGARVSIEVRSDQGRALLAVRDFGEGIAPQHLPRLTERFYRVDAARSRNSGGTGLGLAIVKHIVERHRGTLDIRSSPGQGTTVEIRLPFA